MGLALCRQRGRLGGLTRRSVPAATTTAAVAPAIPAAVTARIRTIGTAKVAKSAFEAKEIGYFRTTDGITMNRDRLLFDAKQKALALVKDYKAPEAKTIRLAGPTVKAALSMAVEGFRQTGKATPHDVVVSDKLSDVRPAITKDITE